MPLGAEEKLLSELYVNLCCLILNYQIWHNKQLQRVLICGTDTLSTYGTGAGISS